MKVLALNSSPRGEGQSKTEMILNPLVEGMREAGAQVEVVDLRHKTVRNCIGCYTCWTKTPGVCIHKDDMTLELFPRWLEADMAVYATPLYHFTMNASMKAFIERTLPVLEPFLIQVKDQTTHPLRHKMPKVVVMSVAGFPEMAVFDQLSSYARFLFGRGLLAEIYRPGAEGLARMPSTDKREEIFKALRGAGSEWSSTEGLRRNPRAHRAPWSRAPRSPRWGTSCGRRALSRKSRPKRCRSAGLSHGRTPSRRSCSSCPWGFGRIRPGT